MPRPVAEERMSKKLQQPVVPPRFVRSANVEFDHKNPRALDGYMLTSGARRVLGRIAPSLTDAAAPRAWTLTGPYGTGKSSFAVFAAQLLAPKTAPGNSQARAILRDGDEDLFEQVPAHGKQFKGLLPIAVTGSREPLHVAILRGLKAAVGGVDALHAVARKAGKLLHQAETGDGLTDRDLIDTLTETAAAVAENEASGLFVVIDELGKLLEFTAAQPNQSDVYLLQHLAELAARSAVPILIVTILHKDFAGYADRLSSHERAEWTKVSGRFEDIVFEESADEVLRLVALARTTVTQADGGLFAQRLPDAEARRFNESAEQAWKLGLAPAGMAKPEFISLLKDCWPLHPLVAVLLGPVFRKLAQNERSVFSFLSSREPYGLFDFLASPDRDPSSVYGLDRLYDYLWNSLGEGLYAQRNGKKWAEVESALERLPEATPAAVSILKQIGVISAIGGTKNIQATPDVIKFGAGGVTKPADVPDAIKLLAEASVITNRRYNNTLSLWEGSDVDLDERVKAARDQSEIGTSLATLAARFISLRPIVARRHSFDTGTLRYFTVEFVEPAALAIEASKPTEADGRILVVIPSNAEERATIERLVKDEAVVGEPRVLVAMPGESRSIDLCVRELAYMDWVREHTPELAGDLTARKELRARVADLQRQLDVLASDMLVPSSADKPACDWFHLGKRIRLGSRRAINDHVSETCKGVFSKTPYIHNELVNRRELSSQAAAARRNLIELMIEKTAVPGLGIEGYPPEKSMYLSVLEQHGLHRKGADGWEFGPPKRDADAGIHAVWEAIQQFFDATQKQPATVETLFTQLRAEPFGLRDGLLPVLLCAALIANDFDVALYEKGTFLPQLTVAAFERLMKVPDQFTVRRWHISGVRATVFRQLADMLGKSWKSPKIVKRNVLDVVRPLLRFINNLPDYTKVTDQVSEPTKRVRSALTQAREADQLLFVDLPRACGFPDIDPDASLSDEKLDAFLTELRGRLGELQRFYDTAIGEVGQALGSAFGLAGDNAVIRERLTARAISLRDWIADPSLKNFVARVIDPADERTWIESVAALLSERPTKQWRDSDRAKFELSLARTARMFRNIEVLAVPSNGSTNGHAEAIRIGVTTKDGGDMEEVVHVGPEDRASLDKIVSRLGDAVQAAGMSGRKELVLAALAQVAKRMLPPSNEP